MTDTTPATTPAATPKPHRTRNSINQRHLEELAHARAVAKAALDPANTAALTAVEFDSTLPGQINTLATSVETAIGKLTGARATKTNLTAAEVAARDALISLIAPIQTAAKRKFTGSNQPLRHAYFIGEDLHNDNLHEVQQAAVAIRDRLVTVPPAAAPLDVLPGIKAAQITALVNGIALYVGNLSAEAGQQNQNTGALDSIQANLHTLAGLRHQVQLAAEQAFPYRTSGMAATRQAFLLPTDKPLAG